MANIMERARLRRVRLPGLFSAPVTIDQVLVHDDRALLSVRTSEGKIEEVVLPILELEQRLAESQASAASTLGLVPGSELFPVLESARIRLAFAYDPYFAVSLSGVAALPHQLEAVYERMLPQPRLRFLLADDPGAGKTIMAGLLIKELKLRGVIERVLILSPAPLTLQWQDELYERFDEPFTVVDSHVETRQSLGNYWQNTPLCIASLDYAKRDDRDGGGRSVRDAILQVPWDLVIVDEAHKCSARFEGQSIRPTKRYQLVEDLSRRTDRLLLLTATPHQGKDAEFGLFLRLLDPDQFVDAREMDETKRLLREKDCPFFLRRMKEDLRDFSGKKLFVKREVQTEDFTLDGDEFRLYQEVTAYVQQFLGRTPTGKKKATVNLARSVLQRRLASSAHAITASLERRRDKLALLVSELEKLPPQEQERRLREAGILDQDDEQDAGDRDEQQQEQAATLATAAESLDMLRREVVELRRLCAFSTQVRDGGHEAKLNKLKDCLINLHLPDLPEGEARLLIFTEHRDTLHHLEKTLVKEGYSVVTIHGGHNPQERKERRRQFMQEKQVCIATEAAGEGVNLQFCHLMINYDVPWNPMRLEQRMGRIHRIGQRRAVHVFNFVATNTEEGKVLCRLLAKLKTIQERLGDRIYDVVGSLLRENDIDLEDMMREVLLHPQRADDFVAEVEQLSEERLRQFEESTGVALARRHVDLSPLRQKTQVHEDLRLMPEYVERFFREAARVTGLHIEDRADAFLRIDPVAARFRSPLLGAVARFGQARDRYLKVTFRKEQRRDRHQDADLLSPGHPLYAATVEIFLQKLSHAQGGTALFLDPGASAPYQIHVFEVQVLGEDSGEDRRQGRDVVVDARFVPVIQQDGKHEVASQDIFHDLTPLDLKAEAGAQAAARAEQGGMTVGPTDPDAVRGATTWLRLHLQHDMVQKARARRGTDARIKREYLERAFDALLARKGQQRFVELERREGGDATAAGRLSILDDSIQQVEMRRDDRLRALSRLEVARAGAVIHLGSALVVPLPDGDTARLMHPDPEVERVAVERAMAHERDRGYAPEYVGDLKDGRGYDILSWSPKDDSGAQTARRIEVKGRAQDHGDVALSRNEWIKAQRLGSEYWLYVIYGARPDGAQRLVIIQDPARVLGTVAQELVVVQGYRVPGAAIVKAGHGADDDR